MEQRPDEKKICDRLKSCVEFQVSTIPTTTRILANRMANTDLLIVCNNVLIRNFGFSRVRQIHRQNEVPIYVALQRTQLKDVINQLKYINGCIFLDGDLNLLPNILHMARNGYCVLPDAVNNEFIDFRMEQAWIGELSMIECAFLHLLGVGQNEKEIARHLGLQLETVSRLLKSLLRKIRISDIGEVRSFTLRNREMLHQRRRFLMQYENTNATTARN